MANPCRSCDLTIRDCVLLSADRKKFSDFLINHGLINQTRACTSCNEPADLNINGLYHTCRCVRHVEGGSKKKNRRIQCSFKKSCRVGTWFHKSKASIEDLVYFIFLWCSLPFPRQRLIMRELKCSSATVVDWSSFCRELCVDWTIFNSTKLGGPGIIVEIDEAKFGKRKYQPGRRIEGQWVFGGFERSSKKVFLVPVPRRDAATLLGVIGEWIVPGTIIVSDFWRAYDCLEDEGFQHLKINHSLQFVEPNDPTIHTQNMERTWRDVRGGVPRYGRKTQHFIGYLAEFLFKRRFKDADLVHNFCLEVTRLYPPPQ